MPIPAFTNYGLLPAGTHVCTAPEVVARYCNNPNRATIWANFLLFAAELKPHGWGNDVLIDGGFTSDKPVTKDIDIVLDIAHLPPGEAFKVFCWHTQHKARVEAQYQVDFWVYHPQIGNDLRAFFGYVKPAELIQRNAPAGTLKGMLRITI